MRNWLLRNKTVQDNKGKTSVKKRVKLFLTSAAPSHSEVWLQFVKTCVLNIGTKRPEACEDISGFCFGP
jgi:hypothetical protein